MDEKCTPYDYLDNELFANIVSYGKFVLDNIVLHFNESACFIKAKSSNAYFRCMYRSKALYCKYLYCSVLIFFSHVLSYLMIYQNSSILK